MNLPGSVSARLRMVVIAHKELPPRVAETLRPDNIGTGEGMTPGIGLVLERGEGRISANA
jgi:hypothetical protein